jgi:hypothetical protein
MAPYKRGYDTGHQDNVIKLTADLAELDAALLRQLPPGERAQQVRARRALGQYADMLWDAARTTTSYVEPSHRDRYNCVAALRDLALELYSNAAAAMREAEADADPDDEHPDPDVWAQSWTPAGTDVMRYTLPKRGQPEGS